jgi:hypothetical protein
MALKDLLIQTQNDFVTNENFGTSEEITYNHNQSLVTETTRAFIDNIDINKESSESVETISVFNNVILTETPRENDTIVYDSKTYIVESWKKQHDMYIIRAELHRYTGRR